MRTLQVPVELPAEIAFHSPYLDPSAEANARSCSPLRVNGEVMTAEGVGICQSLDQWEIELSGVIDLDRRASGGYQELARTG